MSWSPWQTPGARYLACPPLFDPEEGVTVREPLGSGRGWWAGAPSAFHDDETGTFYLYYRLRKPRELGRGVMCRIAAGSDGLEFRDVWQAGQEDLRSPSIEKSSIFRLPDGTWQLYISYVDPDTGMWRIDLMEADDPEQFEPASARPVFLPQDLGLAGIKDPAVYCIGGLYHMIVSYAPDPEAVTDDLRRTMHATGDVYNTGTVKSHTGLATSEDGRNWVYEGDILTPPDEGWDQYCTRIGSVLSLPPLFVGFYDGSASVEENYEEQAGLAISRDLRCWRRITTARPWVASPWGCIRYVEALPSWDAVYYYYEYTREDGSHELRASRVELD
ncbi:MAG TPA: hypothetical protein VM283_00070 [Armatimonadota bacterium]|nr:hypothetical protein [Armatimonadota bacterium]